MFRYQKFNYLAQSFQLSKNAVYNLDSLILVKDIKLEVGHLKPNNTHPEHGLLLFELSNQAPEVRLIKHGKRLKNTILLGSTVSSFRK